MYLNSKTFNDPTNPHDLNNKLVGYSDPHCSFLFPSSLIGLTNVSNYEKIIVAQKTANYILITPIIVESASYQDCGVINYCNVGSASIKK